MKKIMQAKKSGGSSNGTSRSSGASRSTKSQSAGASDDTMLEEFFLNSIKDIYWAEKHLVKTLPKMKKAATTEELKQAFEDHVAVTEEQVARLEEVFALLGKKPQGKKCEAMEGLTKEAEEVIEETEKGSMTRDVALIISAQKVEHYEIATYGGLVQVAKNLGHEDIATILETTLQEEKETDQLLTGIAESQVNAEASRETEMAE